MIKIITLIVLLVMLPASAQLYQAKMQLVNGETKNGYADFPSNSMFAGGSVTLKSGKKDKGNKFKKEEISNILYTTDTGKDFYFECTQVQHLLGKHEIRLQKKKFWIVATYGNPQIVMYSFGESYNLNKDGIMVVKSAPSGTWAEIFVCFKRPGEEMPTSVTSYTFGATVVGHDKRFRAASAKYFEGEAAFIERIENKEWEHDQVMAMAEAYKKYKGGE